MPDYHIERAKSARSSCKKCKEKILKDEFRIGISSMNGDIVMTSYQHPACFQIPKTIKSDAATFVDEHLEDQTADGALEDPEIKQQIIDAISSNPVKRNGGTDDAISKKIASYKKAFEELPEEEEEDEDAKRPAKKAKKDDSEEAAARAYGIYSKMNNDKLKDVLRWNLGYGMTGTKDVLLLRCIDGHVNGRLARCPTCFKGKVQLADKDAGESVACSGFFDEDLGHRIPCTYVASSERAHRLQPWYSEAPTEEEKEEIARITEEHEANAGGGGGSDGAPAALLEAANKLDWDTSTVAGKKEAANLMVELCTTGDVKVDLPQDEKKARMACGKIIVANPDDSASEILEKVVKEFGLSAKKLAIVEQQKEAIADSCACPANAAVMQAFLELGNLYFKEGNGNAGGSYKKAANAIMSLDFVITAENAKGLCKGKTKVPSIGKGSADKIYEFLTTGTIQKLEEKRMLAS